jgi:hypothetical protein
LDYGGIAGVKISAIFLRHLSIFGSAGLQVAGFGWNAGITGHILPEDSRYFFRPNIKLMYGVNSATMVIGKSEYDMQFFGFTPGIGLEFMFGKKKANGFDVDIDFPIRGKDFEDHMDLIKSDPTVAISDPLPIALSFGYHHEF